MLRLLAAGGTVVDFGERAPKGDAPSEHGKTARLAARATELVDEARAAGGALSFAEAVTRAEREEEPQ